MKFETLLALACLFPSVAFASYHFEVNHPPYQALIEVENCTFAQSNEDSGSCGGKGKIILKKQNWQQTFTADDLSFYLDKNKQPSQKMAFYDEESPLIFDDFNFDGNTDLAIHNGNYGGYGSPTYDVYVFAKNSQKFIKSKELTALASEHQGMFVVNSQQKYLETRDKSGAGWHQISRYSIVLNKGLKLIYQWTEEYHADGFVTIDTKSLTKNGWKTTTKKIDSEKYTAE